MSSRPSTAIVLAGGRSSRFGRDKLAEIVDGRPLLDHVIGAVRPLAAEIVVVRPHDDDRPAPPRARVVRDPIAFEGPLVGLQTALHGARHDVALVLAGDMPEPAPNVLALLLAALDDPGVEAAQLGEADQARPVPLAVRRQPAREAADRLVAAGERRLRALPAALRTVVIEERVWRPLDPDGRTLRDIDTPGDLG